MFGNWRQIISLNDIEYCSAVKDPNSAMSKIVANVKNSFQGLIHKCPYNIGPLRLHNFTDSWAQKVAERDTMDGKKFTKEFSDLVYNGDMRIKLKLRNKADPNILDFMLALTISYRNAATF